MKRIILIILRNLYRIPFIWFKLCHYAKHSDRYSEKQKYSFIRKIARWMVNGGRITLEVYGAEHIPQESGFMIFPNHQGLFDGFAIVQALEVPFSTVYKKELENVPFMKQVFSCVKAIPLNREDIRQGLEVINKVADEVKEGRNFMIFSEGTRSKNGNQLLDFKGGSFKSAIKAKCPIMPIALIDSYKVFDVHSIKRITVQVHLLEPLQYEDYKEMKAAQIASVVKESIEKTVEKHSQNESKNLEDGRI